LQLIDQKETPRDPKETKVEQKDQKDPVKEAQTKDSARKKEEKAEKAALKLDSSTALFAQHFGIIRELKNSCSQLKEGIRKETDYDTLKKTFEQILQVLDAGCQFLTFPINL